MPSTLSPDLGPRCMQAFTQVVPASLCVFYRIDEDCRAHDFQLLRMPAGMHRDYLRHYRDYDPLQPRHCLASVSPVVPLRCWRMRISVRWRPCRCCATPA